MKKIFKTALILFVFCLTFALSGFFVETNQTFAEEEPEDVLEPTIVEIGSDPNSTPHEELENYINNYTDANQFDKIVLTADIDMSLLIEDVLDDDGDKIGEQQKAMTKTIGTEAAPFKGTFDGQGFNISNLKFDVSNDMTVEGATLQSTQYGALFGVTSGATIKNVSIEGAQNIRVGGCVDAYVGGIVAYAKNTKFSHLQANSNIVCENVYDCNVEMGEIAGCAIDNSSIEYVISRPSTGFAAWIFNTPSNKISSFGGLVGRLSNSQIKFCVVESKFDIAVSSAFEGILNVGGIVGKVDGKTSEIVDVVCENRFVYVNNAGASDLAVVYLGEIAGAVSTPVPNSKCISYIKFKQNDISRFGSMGSYTYADADLYDMILPASGLNDLDNAGASAPDYFANTNDWHIRYGTWDFENIWYVDSRAINLQVFYKGFNLNFENSDVLELKTELKSAYNYGEKIELEFAFKDKLDEFFSLTGVSLSDKHNRVSTTSIYTTLDANGNDSYSIIDSDYFSIVSKVFDEEGVVQNGFVLTIKKITRSTTGNYSFVAVEKQFSMSVSTRLYKENELQSNLPGYVYFAGSSVTTSENLVDHQMYYGRTCRLETRIKSNTANRFVGWCLVQRDESGNEIDSKILSLDNRILEISFGTGDFVGDFEVYAKYEDNACLVSFLIDEGIEKIELYSGGVVVEESTTEGSEVGVSKSESNLKLEIFVRKGRVFDAETFIKDNTIYKAGDSDINIFTQTEMRETETGVSYLFILDMTLLTGDQANSFTIKATTSKDENNGNSWLWWAIGGGAAGLILIVVIIVVVVVKKRSGFGGGGSYSKKSFKNNYF